MVSVLGGKVAVLPDCISVWSVTFKRQPVNGSVGVQFELLMLIVIAVPAIRAIEQGFH